MVGAAAPCADQKAIGALFDEFLSLSAPYADAIITSPVGSPTGCTIASPPSPCANNPAQVTTPPASPAKAQKRKSPQLCGDGTKKPKKRTKKDELDSGDDADTCKKARRRKQNRVAAQTSREKKKKYLTDLEQKVSDLSKQNQDLQSQLLAIQEENARLRAGNGDFISAKPDPFSAMKPEPIEMSVKVEEPAIELDYIMDQNPTPLIQEPTTFESAEFSPQQSEVVFSALMSLLVLIAVSLPSSFQEMNFSTPQKSPSPTPSPATRSSTSRRSSPWRLAHPSYFQYHDIARRKAPPGCSSTAAPHAIAAA